MNANAIELPLPVLPTDGLDLRDHLRATTESLHAQALERTDGDRGKAAKLLGSGSLDIERLRRVLGSAASARASARTAAHAASARAAGPVMKQPREPDATGSPANDATAEPGQVAAQATVDRDTPTRTDLAGPTQRATRLAADMGRVNDGVLLISREVIVRLDAEGYTSRQIAAMLVVNHFFVERVLRMTRAPLAKCGAKSSGANSGETETERDPSGAGPKRE